MLDIIQCIQSISKGLRFALTLAFRILAVVDRPLGDRVRITRKKVQPKFTDHGGLQQIKRSYASSFVAAKKNQKN